MAVRTIHETSSTEGEVHRRIRELIECMQWRGGEQTLAAYDHYFDAFTGCRARVACDATILCLVGLVGTQADGSLERTSFMHLVEHLHDVMAPHFPEHDEAWWWKYRTNMASTWEDPLPYTDTDLRGVAPTLLVVSDRDEFVPVEDGLAKYRMMPHVEVFGLPPDACNPNKLPRNSTSAARQCAGRAL
jgi:hypothetical protein